MILSNRLRYCFYCIFSSVSNADNNNDASFVNQSALNETSQAFAIPSSRPTESGNESSQGFSSQGERLNTYVVLNLVVYWQIINYVSD